MKLLFGHDATLAARSSAMLHDELDSRLLLIWRVVVLGEEPSTSNCMLGSVSGVFLPGLALIQDPYIRPAPAGERHPRTSRTSIDPAPTALSQVGAACPVIP